MNETLAGGLVAGVVSSSSENMSDMPRLAWIITALIAFLVAFLLLLAGYVGYAGLSAAVGASAAINLR